MTANFVRAGRSIIAIGRNFAEHAKELNNAVPTEPFYFLKPVSSYLPNGGKVEVPRGCTVHHEGAQVSHATK
jgi:acylpyruvate hydrolase